MAVTKGFFVRWSLALVLGVMVGEADCYAPGWGGAPDSTPGPVTPGPGDDCDGDYQKVQPSDKCYKWYDMGSPLADWRQCRRMCERDQAHIATPRSAGQTQALVAILRNNTMENVPFRNGSRGPVYYNTYLDYFTVFYCQHADDGRIYVLYVDYCGIPLQYTNWQSGEGSNLGGESLFYWDKSHGCTEMSTNGKWHDVACDGRGLSYENETFPSCICEKKASGQQLCDVRRVGDHGNIGCDNLPGVPPTTHDHYHP